MATRDRSALVVLKPEQRLDVDPHRAGEVSPPEAVVHHVVRAFSDAGFDVGPYVGVSFAITGTQAAFERVFGVDPLAEDFDQRELPMTGLKADVAPYVAAVTMTEPPAFGPGNP